jgi:predicted nucleic acid-binding protein
MAKLRALVDANILLDALAYRQPFYPDSARVWVAVESGRVEGFIAAHTVTTLHYLLMRHYSAQTARQTLAKLLSVFDIAAVNKETLLQALALGWNDYEDAVQVISASQCHSHYWVTRDAARFSGSPVPPISPAEFNRLTL